jgi:hypothetical protein
MMQRDVTGKIYLLLAGACDGVSGLLLLFAPLPALRMMGVETPPVEPLYIQWIGAFVFAGGSIHFLPWCSRSPGAFARRARTVLEATGWMRVVIGVFAAVMIVRGGLSLDWISVPLTDLSLAAVQGVLLVRGVFAGEAR